METTLRNTSSTFMRDTPFASLMNKRIYNVLLIATPYDAFMLETDGRVDEEIFNEYTSLNLRYPPRFTRVTTDNEALNIMADRHFELVVVMPNLANADPFSAAHHIKAEYPHTPIVVLTPFSKEMNRRMLRTDFENIDYVFSWLGDAQLLLAIIKLIEDGMNAPHDIAEVGVQAIILVEDSVRFYSLALPLLYLTILEQSRDFSNEALNDHLKMLRMRGRPKVLLARNYEEAMTLCKKYANNILGFITDISFKREGSKDKYAGIRLAKWIREKNKHLPIILQSADTENKKIVQQMQLPFVQKYAKDYAINLHNCIIENFGFGDFVIYDPNTKKEVVRIKNLKDLQLHLNDIPDEILRKHLNCNHISRFLYSRAIFPPAEILRKHDASLYKNMDEARYFINNLIDRYRIMKHAGVVAAFHKDSYDDYNNFTRIGKGSLGGKGRGLAFMNTFIKNYQLQKKTNETIDVDIPKTVVICTDVFDVFMQHNNLYPIALSSTTTDEDIFSSFEKAVLPNNVLDDLASLLTSTHTPIAVRSSSLLEDSHFQPFAGVYATYMVPYTSNKECMLQHLCDTIKAVYASVFYKESKNYLAATQNLIDQEKMAVVLQEVVGKKHDNLFYPTLSGVARSFNFYPTQDDKAEDGVVNIALGLGKQIVEGGKSLRFTPVRPQHCLQTSDIKCALSNTQDSFWALNMQDQKQKITRYDNYNLQQVMVKDIPKQDLSIPYIFSTFDWQNNRMIPGFYPHLGRVLVTFQSLLNTKEIAIGKVVQDLLHLGRKEMGREVEIEFAIQYMPQQTAHFYLLQIRPIADFTIYNEKDQFATLKKGIDLALSDDVLGSGNVSDIYHIIYVKNKHYSVIQRIEIAQQIDKINANFTIKGQKFLLIGDGRWGNSDATLGIPVNWSQISAVATIIETDMAHRHIEASQGSHFFQNLTSLGVPYFTINNNTNQQYINTQWLENSNAIYENEFIKIIHVSKPLLITVNCKQKKGLIKIMQ